MKTEIHWISLGTCHCYLIKEEGLILVDAGFPGRGKKFLGELKSLSIEPKDISLILLTHSHWDHIGGLPHLLSRNNDLELFIPTSFSKHLKAEISKRTNMIEVIEPLIIDEYCISTGELGENIKEQSLLVKSRSGIVVVTGCSHPGLENILKIARGFGEIYGVLGGFHGFNKYEALKGIELICPCHCTENRRKIEKLYQDAYRKCGAGMKLKI